MTDEVATTEKDPLRLLVAEMNPELKAALPNIGVTVERIGRVFMTCVRKTPKLMQCSRESMAAALMQSAELGLEFGSSLGHLYLVPYGKEAQAIIGFRGMIELARRSGEVKSLNAHIVYEKDQFDYTLGLEEKLIHKPSKLPTDDKGPVTHAYFVAHFVNGGHHIEVMDRNELDAIRGRSKSKNNGPWVTDFPEMCRKTVVRRAFKYMPTSIVPARVHEIIENEDIIDVEFADTVNPVKVAAEAAIEDTAPETEEENKETSPPRDEEQETATSSMPSFDDFQK